MDIGLLKKLIKIQGTKREVIFPEAAHSDPNKKENTGTEYIYIKAKNGIEIKNRIIVNFVTKLEMVLRSK